jgi:hypothetical protein
LRQPNMAEHGNGFHLNNPHIQLLGMNISQIEIPNSVSKTFLVCRISEDT